MRFLAAGILIPLSVIITSCKVKFFVSTDRVIRSQKGILLIRNTENPIFIPMKIDTSASTTQNLLTSNRYVGFYLDFVPYDYGKAIMRYADTVNGLRMIAVSVVYHTQKSPFPLTQSRSQKYTVRLGKSNAEIDLVNRNYDVLYIVPYISRKKKIEVDSAFTDF